MIVDDDPDILLALREGLEKYSESFSVITAAGGESAIRKLRDHVVSLVVTDMKMPGMNGFSLLAHIMENYSDIPVIIVTGYGTPEMKRRAAAGGAVGFVEKPFKIEDLAREITSTLRRESEGGILHGISSATFLQLIAMEQKTCTIRVEERGTGRRGVLFFLKGELLDARVNGSSGLEAAYEIFSWEHVNLSIQNTCNKRERKIQRDLQGILLEAMRRKDEFSGEPGKPATGEPYPAPPQDGPPESFDEIRGRLDPPSRERWGIEEIYRDRSWEEPLDRLRSAGERLGAGRLKLAYLDRGTVEDIILVPLRDGEPAAVTVKHGSPKDRILRALIEDKPSS